MTAIAAVDIALWDIKAKAANMPLYQLGGKSRERVMVYGHATGKDIEGCLDEVARHVELGYKEAVRVQCGDSRDRHHLWRGQAQWRTL